MYAISMGISEAVNLRKSMQKMYKLRKDVMAASELGEL